MLLDKAIIHSGRVLGRDETRDLRLNVAGSKCEVTQQTDRQTDRQEDSQTGKRKGRQT